MRRSIVLIWISALFLAGTVSVWGGDGDAGQIGSTWRIGQGARGLAMGSAFTAIADDASAVYYNPAGLAQIQDVSLDFAWRAMPLLDRKQGYFVAGFPLVEDAALGLSWIYSGVGSITERDSRGAAGDDYSFSDNLFTATFARVFGRLVAIGGSVHYAHQTLFNVSANTAGFSAGMHVRFDRSARRPFSDALQRLTLAASVQHIGMKFRFDSNDYYGGTAGGTRKDNDNTDRVPVMGRVAAAYRFLHDRSLLVSLEGTYVEHQHLRPYAGAEWTIDPRLKLRAGLADADPTFGFGLAQKWGGSNIRLDYAFLTNPAGGDADHVVSLGVGF